MSIFLGHLGVALIVGAFFFCAVVALSGARLSGGITQEEEVAVLRRRFPANTN
ncbi:hypothetical protein [Rhizobium lentis]|uniref:hypothetical protein n=1 Tax=Rhizobium lentis TaxID=1138194 RepID=UPI001A9148FF|nr:hypothetical protein [Rhizobium lentis]MBX5063291.1 hypothetical protein [Rhizobium lentis]MBX5075396.1 hypothetical protein [Rhizobium lentis]QSW93053.1 hypothetical protein J0663_18565 [Rhizobium lentis]